MIFGEIISILALLVVALNLAGFSFLMAACPIVLVLLIIGKVLKPKLNKSAEILSEEARNYVNEAMEASALSQVVFGEQRLRFLIDRFALSRRRSGIAYSKVIFIQQMPRFVLETTTILLIVFAFTFSSEPLIASLTLVAPLLLRMLPSLIKFSNLQFDVVKGKPFLDKMQAEILRFNTDKFHSIYSYSDSADNFISVTNLQAQIGDSFLSEPVNFRADSGKILGIVGPSGSGKTSLIECLVKKRNYRGSISIGGPEVRTNENTFAYVPQSTTFLRDTISNNLLLGKVVPNPDLMVRRTLMLAGLPYLADDIHQIIDDYGASGIRLSGGERARLSFARALIVDPKIIVLDELTAGLDEQTEAQILVTIESLKLDRVTVIVTHRASVMKICDEILTIRKISEE